MLVVNIIYDAVTRLMEVDEISTGQPNRVVGTVADNNGTMLHFTFIDLDDTLTDYSKTVQFGSVLVDAEHDTYRPPMTLDENNNVIIPDYIMSHVLRNTLTVQLVLKHTDTETQEVTEYRSLNILKLRVEPAIPQGDMPDPQEVIRYGDLLNGVTYDPDTSTFTYHQMDGGEIYIHLTDLAEDHYDVPTQADLTGPLTEGAENGDTATAEDTGVWYKLYGPRDVLSNWKVMTGNATINGISTGSPVFYAPHVSGEAGQYLESDGATTEEAEHPPVWKSKVTDISTITTGETRVPTSQAVKTYVDTQDQHYDDLAVHKAGAETITGAKTFSADTTFNGTITANSTSQFNDNVAIGTPSSPPNNIIDSGDIRLDVSGNIWQTENGSKAWLRDIEADSLVIETDAVIKQDLNVQGVIKNDIINENEPVTVDDQLKVTGTTTIGSNPGPGLQEHANLIVYGSVSASDGIQTAGNITQATANSTATLKDTSATSLNVTGKTTTGTLESGAATFTGTITATEQTVDASTFTGNAATATKLAATKNINDTAFDGSANITTTKWGTARTIKIQDNDGTNTESTGVSVDGSANATLVLPATIKASLTGNASGNAGTATKWQTKRSIGLSGVTATAQDIDGSADVTIPVTAVPSSLLSGEISSTIIPNHADSSNKYGAGSTSQYGHVKVDSSMSENSTNPVQNSTIMSFVNSSIGTNTANFLGTYDAHDDLGLTIVDESNPTNAQIATALATYLVGQSITASNNDYVFVSLNFPATVDTDEFRRFKYSQPSPPTAGVWEYEYTLNNSSFTQAQWDSINSLVTNTSSPKVGVDVKDINAHLGDDKKHVPANTTADQLLKSNANGQASWVTPTTINSASLLSGGNISLQTPLTAGTDYVQHKAEASKVYGTNGSNVDTTYGLVTSWSGTVSDSNIPSEKLTKDSLDVKITGPSSSTADHILTFSDATGKVAKDSGYTIATSVPSGAVFTDVNVTQTLESGNYNLPILLSHYQTSDSTVNRTATTFRNNGLYANPSTGIVTATGFAGNLTGNVTGNVTGNCSGSAGSVAYSNITSNPIPTPTASQDEGKAIIVNSSGTGFEFGEAGKVDDVKINGASIVSNKIATIPISVTNVTITEVD